ncbi:hypothetical protein ILUMI_11470 [Ignelater luminosus]|uniref:PDZ domain-containing protein n=1 Tax=Ignelater luminosus TaxID=2038154 RepID=A0A8K0CW12_IGNLU|nr:hypothetical protein ILUMI_11470 [Ignelater luminosus]
MGGIQVGDEILEVNGVVLHGRCHLNASAIIKGLAGPIFKIIILRRKMAIDDIAVRPVTQFPVSLQDESLEDKFSGYPNVRNIAIQKGNHSLGIMIIEGKHAELGQGIFISDIQDGSAAEKAGLEVGEMILAVNKEPLLGADYDTAANLLKRTEGVVTLYLSNPTKKSTTPQPQVPEKVVVEEPKLPTALKPQTQPSRSPTPVPETTIDPASGSIAPGRNSTIEIVTDNHGLGLFFVGGKDTIFSHGIIVIEIFPGGAADKDGRIQDGDVILEANGVCLKEATSEVAIQTLRQTLPKMKLVILRPEKIEYTVIEVDLAKKPGKGLGLSIIGKKNGKGVYVAEVLNGGSADVDGRISKGDLVVSVNGQTAENVSADEAGAILKTVSGKAALKFHRYKPIIR